jgi:glutamate 5-kinase
MTAHNLSDPGHHPLRDAQRLVVKVGSSLLVNAETGLLNEAWLAALIEDVIELRGGGREVLLVSSGAIALGRRYLKLPPGPLRLEDSQAAAAVGQIRLAQAYQTLLAQHSVPVAQVLLTLEDSEQRRRYLNARATLNTLLERGAVPVINENDTVATAEIRYGDNDRLAARVAQMIEADCVLLLSDIDGLYTADPRRDPTAEFISRVERITPAIEAMGGDTLSDFGRGGMAAKLAAARIAVTAGCYLGIAAGTHMNPLRRVLAGAPCTWFQPVESPVTARKQWIAGVLRPVGTLVIDAGALRALQAGKSLLPAGVVAVRGSFERGDTVSVVSDGGVEMARGIVAYSDADARKIAGRRSEDIREILGFAGRDELIHRDDLAMQ